MPSQAASSFPAILAIAAHMAGTFSITTLSLGCQHLFRLDPAHQFAYTLTTVKGSYNVCMTSG